jgi:superfamily II DNA helicase RecQ
MGEVHGVGEAKLARYGETFLEVVRSTTSGED